VRSKPFYYGLFAVGCCLALAISCLGPGDSGNMLLAGLLPFVAVGCVFGLVWGIIERRKGGKIPSGNLAGLILNGMVVGLMLLMLGGWAAAEGWPRVPFRFPRDVPLYPEAKFILEKVAERNPAGGTTETWELAAELEYGPVEPQYVKAERFYDHHLPQATKRRNGNNNDIHYSYVDARKRNVEITITRRSSVIVRISSP
jgi:hypothetical protein